MRSLNSVESGRLEPRKKRYLFERIGVYFILMVILALATAIILALPYSHTYIGDFGADDIYLRSFVYMAVAAVAILVLGLFYNVMIWMEGKLTESDEELPRTKKLTISTRNFMRAIFSRDFGRAMKFFLVDTLLLRKFWRINKMRWLFHALILFGFLGIFILDIITTAALEIFEFSSFIEPLGWGKLWIRDFGFDLFGLMLLIGLLGAVVRRFIMRPKQLVTGAEDVLSVLLLLAVVFSGFVMEGIGMASGIPGHAESPDIYSFIGAAFASFLPAVSVQTYAQLWMLHAALSLAFIAYIPFSKLFHMFAAPLAMQLNEIIGRRESSSGK